MASDRRDLTEGFLFTDQYQLTMAQVYWKYGLHERPALFDYFFRSYPDYGRHQAGYAVTAGLGWLLDRIETTRISDEDLALLRGQVDVTGKPRFDEGFLAWLKETADFTSVSIRAVPEGCRYGPGRLGSGRARSRADQANVTTTREQSAQSRG